LVTEGDNIMTHAHRLQIGIIGLLVLLATLIGSSLLPSATVAQTTGFRVDGTRIIDPDGKTFYPIGANYLGPHSWWPSDTLPLAQVSQEAWKFNMIRLNSCLDRGCNEYNWSDNNDFDAIVSAYTSRKIVVMFTLHNWTCNYPSDSDLTLAADWFYDKAVRYKNNPYVWFQPFNEPGYQDPIDRWVMIHQRVIRRIRDDAGANNIIVANGTQCGQEGLAQNTGNTWQTSDFVDASKSAILSAGNQLKQFNSKTYGNIAFSFHAYDQWGNVTSTNDQRDAKMRDYITRVQNAGHALFIGETGGYGNNSTDSKALATKTAYRVAPGKGVGIVAWHATPGDGFNLTTPGGIDAINSTTSPTNLTWHGQLLWNLSHNPPTGTPPAPTPGPTSTPAPPSSSKLIDDFENGLLKWSLSDSSGSNGSITTNTNKVAGTYSMMLSYAPVAAYGYVDAKRSFSSYENWSTYNGIEFWLNGNNQGINIKLYIEDNGGEIFETTVTADNFTGWKYFTVPFSTFTRNGTQPAGAPNDGFTRTAIRSYTFRAKGISSSRTGDFKVDQVIVK
jgi:mannan endo-1,4-beta-mannosidase